MVKPEMVTQSEPMILKIASFKLPAVSVELAVIVTEPEVVIVTVFVLEVVPVNEIEYPPEGDVSEPAAQVSVTAPEKAVTLFSAVIALARLV